MPRSRSTVANAVKGSRPGSGLYNASAVPGGGASHIGRSTAVTPSARRAQGNATAGTNVPSPVPGSSSPWDTDPISQAKFTNAATNYTKAIAYDATSRQSLVNSYGFNTVGPNGEQIGAVYTPYSVASLLQRSHEINRRGAVNGAGLSLYSGSTTNHLQQADRRYGQEEAGKRGEFESSLRGIEKEEQEALENKQNAEEEGKEGAVDRAKEDPLPEIPPGLGQDPAHPNAYKAGVGAGKEKPKAPAGYHAYKGPGNQWWFAPDK